MTILATVRSLRKRTRTMGAVGKFDYDLYTLLLGEFERVDREIKDEDAVKIIRKMIKDNNTSIELKASDSLIRENEILRDFLPTEMTEEEILDIAIDCYENDKSIGDFMKAVRAAGKEVDMKAAKEIWLQQIKG